MKTYISLLRGINVGGNNHINMKELKSKFENLGLQNVQTYLQTGNIIFNTKKHISDTEISEAIKTHFKLNIEVLLFEASEFEKIINRNPFFHEKESYLTFFKHNIYEPEPGKLLEKKLDSEKFLLTQSALYLHCPDGYGKTKLNNNFVEKTVNTLATTRNFNTSRKLLELLKLNL